MNPNVKFMQIRNKVPVLITEVALLDNKINLKIVF